MNCRILILFLAALLYFPSIALSEEDCQATQGLLLENFVNQNEQHQILSEFNSQIRKFESLGLRRSYCQELQLDLKAKLIDGGNPLKISSSDVIRHAILYEGFRIDNYLSSGVAPMRYFGFFDEVGNTANFERILRITIIDAVRITNEFAKQSNLKSRINEKEIAVTFLSEGGALLLTNPEDSPNRVHPVRGVGLDDYRLGFAIYPGLVKQYDNFFGTKIGSLIVPFAGRSLLLRPMTFREAILGTVLMYLYEKEIATILMRKEWGTELMGLSPRQQYVSASLVYNSGILFSKERVKQIEEFSTGDYLALLNENADKPKLFVSRPEESLRRLQSGLLIPRQLTSWSAVYHILQRYGAWIALERFSETFKDEAFVKRE